MTSLEHLAGICPPPSPSAVPVVDWRAVEEAVDFELPGYYKELASRYGPGAFGGFIRIHHPAAPTPWVDLTGPVPAIVRAQMERDQASSAYRPPHDPQLLFPVGVTDNGNYLFWVTDPEDRPDTWRVAVNEARGPRWYTHDGNLTDFLAGVLSGRLAIDLFPTGLLDGGTPFVPSSSPDSSPSPDSSSPPGSGAQEAPRLDPEPPVRTSEVRAWARANGYEVPDRGRVPADVIARWREANQ
ncbi:Lsr2 family protein [Streptomyces sp. P38-E01]|uniref:Lsr2 family protein n=1 Tax=Streptomyces tardus TaxID=2780544 RepID=A0A949N783_9ACTN|nr:histone-like nucleoid-structuring protein Lsr2 [Streptomyces tardus]MBU7596733.1 Lsr2 family protein [Streptomyces tardus]